MIKETENTSYICPPMILVEQCRIAARGKELVKPFNWQLKHDQVWVVVGAGGGGKEAFRDALAGYGNTLFETTAATESRYANTLTESTVCVSLESAAALIHEERTRDESDYIEGGVDHGRTARVYISEVLAQTPQEQQHLASRLESMPETRLCGIEAILDRGIKYLSTGEIRRTLICRALLSGKRFLILSEPFAGLDIQSRTMLTHFFNSIAHRQAATSQSGGLPRVMLFMERYTEIPDAVTHVAEFAEGALLFSGTRAEYEKFSAQNSSDRSGAEQKRHHPRVLNAPDGGLVGVGRRHQPGRQKGMVIRERHGHGVDRRPGGQQGGGAQKARGEPHQRHALYKGHEKPRAAERGAEHEAAQQHQQALAHGPA